MTFILGTGRLSYDHFGDYNRIHHVATAEPPGGIRGDSSALGEAGGGFQPCEDFVDLEITVEVIQ